MQVTSHISTSHQQIIPPNKLWYLYGNISIIFQYLCMFFTISFNVMIAKLLFDRGAYSYEHLFLFYLYSFGGSMKTRYCHWLRIPILSNIFDSIGLSDWLRPSRNRWVRVLWCRTSSFWPLWCRCSTMSRQRWCTKQMHLLLMLQGLWQFLQSQNQHNRHPLSTMSARPSTWTPPSAARLSSLIWSLHKSLFSQGQIRSQFQRELQ